VARSICEVGIGGDDHVAVGRGPVEDRLIARMDQVDIADVACLETGFVEPGSNAWGEVRVEQQPHAGWATGSSRSFTMAAAYSSAASTSSRSRYG
jgi:hypothetical protein